MTARACLNEPKSNTPNLLARASRLAGISEKTALVRAGLEALIVSESAKRLAALAGNERRVRGVPRWRPDTPA